MRTLFLLLIISCSLLAERTKKLHPSLQASVERLKIGDLTSPEKSPASIGTIDEQARIAYEKALAAHDKEGIEELLSAKTVSILDSSATVRVLERNEDALDRLMGYVYQAVDLDIDIFKACGGRNVRRARAGLRLEDCGHPNYDAMYDARMTQFLNGVSPDAYVDSHVQVLVRVLSGPSAGKKLWLQFGNLVRPSHPDPNVHQ